MSEFTSISNFAYSQAKVLVGNPTTNAGVSSKNI